MSQPKDQIQSISYTIDETARKQKIRHSLQPTSHATEAENNYVQRPRSVSLNKKTQIVIEAPIPEADTEEDDETQGGTRLHADDSNTLRTSFTKKPPSRSNSYAGIKAKIVEVKGGFENGAYDGSQQFQRGYTDSTRSSTQSMQVHREQYCCCSKWSPFERKLATSVAILATVIIGLAITVGLLADGDDKEGLPETFIWKP